MRPFYKDGKTDASGGWPFRDRLFGILAAFAAN
jgi:hypothetical protein